MKICFVGLSNLPVLASEYGQYGAGGEEVQQTLLARAFARRGHSVSMVVFDYGQPDGAIWDGIQTFRAFGRNSGIPVVRFIHPRWTGLVAALRRADADVYYVSPSSVHVGTVAHFAHRHGKRVIYRVAANHACDPETVMIRHWRDRRLYEYGIRRVDAILVQSEWQREALRRGYGLTSTVASMLVEPARLDLAFAARDIDVLWVNNLRTLKQPHRFLDLAENTPSICSHMIGGPQPGFDELFDDVSRRASTIPSLCFHGPVPYREVNDYYERARVFVNTSDTEGFPNSYLQAWVRGTPVVAFFDPDGIIAREGLGAAVKTASEMQDSILRLTSDSESWRTVSERCRQYMRAYFGDDTVLAPYLAAFHGELPSPSPVPLRGPIKSFFSRTDPPL